MIGRKQAVVDQTTGGIDFLMKKNNIDVYEGLGSFKDATHIKIEGKDKGEIEAKNIIIATGSKPSNLPFITLDKERIITSTEALKLKEIPKHMIVIGGGVIGLELGQVYRRLGAEVTVIEYQDRILPTMDKSLSKELNKVFKKAKLSNIYAIGDVVKGAMLAHKAEEEGVFVAETLAGQKPHIDYNLIPGVVYTWPEVAAVGQTEEELQEAGVEYKSGQFPFRALGRARAGGDIDGFVKILADKTTDEVLGVHMIGARCADLIAEAVTAMEFRASAEDISRMSHAHPTFAEAVKEAALAATDDRALHV